MAIAVASSATTAVAIASTCVITKPTGLAAGDLMIAMVGGLLNTAADYTAPGGWTVSQGATTGGESCRIFYKVADSGDAAATNFTFSGSGSEYIGGAMIRVTGQSGDVSIFSQQQSNDNNFASADLTPNAADSLLLFFGFTTGSATGLSSYACAVSNPTWTEEFDFGSTAPATDLAFSLGYAVRAAATATGDFTAGNSGTTIGFFMSLSPLLNVTASPSVITTTVTIEAPSVSAGASITTTVVTTTVTVQSPTVTTGEGMWTNQDKSSSSWTNQNKS